MPSLTSSQKIFVAFGAVAVFFFAAWAFYEPGAARKDSAQGAGAPKVSIVDGAPDESSRWTEEYAGTAATSTGLRAASALPAAEDGNLSASMARNMSDEFRARFISPTMSEEERRKLFQQLQDGTFQDAPDFSDYMGADKIGFVDSISKKELHVLSDDSSASRNAFLGEYLRGIEPLRDENVNEFIDAFNGAVKNHDKAAVDSMLERYRGVYTSLSKLSTPPSMQDLQARTLVFLKNMLTTFAALRGFDEDPVRAYAAMQHFSDLAGEWSAITQLVTSLTP